MIEPNDNIKEYLHSHVGKYVNKVKGIDIFVHDIKKKYGLKEIIKYDLGENSDGPSPTVLFELTKSILNPNLISKYPDSSYSQLKTKLAQNYGLEFENFSIGTGSCEIIEQISRIWLNRKDRVIIPVPSFYKIEDLTLASGGLPVYINLRENDNFQWNNNTTDRLVTAAKKIKPKLIWLVTPNNPIGGIIPINDMKYIVEQMQSESMIVVDEAYGEYSDNDEKNNSAIEFVKQEVQNVLVLRTFSKAYGLAGLRIGYCVGQKNIIKVIERVRPEFPVTNIAEKIAIHALNDQDYIYDSVAKVSRNRKLLEKSLDAIDDIKYFPSITNTMLIKHNKRNLYMELLKRGFLVAKMEITGLKGKNYIRMTIKNAEENNMVVDVIQSLSS